jgi:hypothetical protein
MLRIEAIDETLAGLDIFLSIEFVVYLWYVRTTSATAKEQRRP